MSIEQIFIRVVKLILYIMTNELRGGKVFVCVCMSSGLSTQPLFKNMPSTTSESGKNASPKKLLPSLENLFTHIFY